MLSPDPSNERAHLQFERSHASDLEHRTPRRAQSLPGIPIQKALKEPARRRGRTLGHAYSLVHDLAEHLPRPALARRRERRIAGEHLVRDASEAPEVGAPAVPLPGDHLGRHVLHRAAERPRPLVVAAAAPAATTTRRAAVVVIIVAAILRQSEIGQDAMPVAPQEYVLRFQIPVKHVQRMQMFQRERDLREVKTGGTLAEYALPPELQKQLAPRAEVHDDE